MKYSIIIPIYNAGLYLEECINSILLQKRNDVEIILVNDGSTDNSLEICKKMQISEIRRRESNRSIRADPLDTGRYEQGGIQMQIRA